LRCCVNLLDLYARLRVSGQIRFHRKFHFIEPGGRVSILRRGFLPAPLHFAASFSRLRFLGAADKLAVARGLLALRREYGRRTDLDRITMLDWLREKNQTAVAIERFWRQILVSAVNEDLDRMAASHGLQVFHLGFLSRPDSYEMGVPAVPLGQLYREEAWRGAGKVTISLRSPVDRLHIDTGVVTAAMAGGKPHAARHYVCALPFDKIPAVAPGLGLDVTPFEHSPITGIHLWFDRAVTSLPHAVLLDRTMQWMFNKRDGRYVQLVVSASRSLVGMSRERVVDLAVRELAEFFPTVSDAKLEKAHVIKEVRATFSACPGMAKHRPRAVTAIRNLFLAGDWTDSGWPSTMEGAVRSGYLAAEAVTNAAGAPRRFLLPDIV